MTRGRIAFFAISLLVVTTILSGGLFAAAARHTSKPPAKDSLYKYLSVFTEILSLVRQSYVEPTKVETLMAGALDGATDALDPFSTYIPPDQVKGFLAARAIGNRRTGLTLVRQGGVAFVVATVPGSPAAKAGLEAGDVVAKVDQASTRRSPVWKIEEMLAGPTGSEVPIEILRHGTTKHLKLKFENYTPPAPTVTEHDGLPVLRIPVMNADAAAKAASLVADLGKKGEQKLLIDLRGTAGGDEAAAYSIGGLFAHGNLGKLLVRDNAVKSFDSHGNPRQRTLVVLIDHGTLGPAEILASILKQAAGAKLIGQSTFGYAGQLALANVGDGGKLLYTDAYYSGPDGKAIDDSVEPDERVTAASRTFAEKDESIEDLILERGLKALSSAGAPQQKKAA